MTHVAIYRRMSRFDTRSFVWTTVTITVVVAALFIAITFIPQGWIDTFLAENEVGYFWLDQAEGLRYVPLTLGLMPTFAFVNMVVGIVTAAETLSYVGAGVTRQASWLDDRRTNVVMAACLWLIAIAGFLVAILLDGGMAGLSLAQVVWWALGTFASFLVGYEVGYFACMLYVRHHWIPASVAIIAYVALVIGVLALQDNEAPGSWNAITWLATVAALIFTVVAAHRMVTTLPGRRNH